MFIHFFLLVYAIIIGDNIIIYRLKTIDFMIQLKISIIFTLCNHVINLNNRIKYMNNQCMKCIIIYCKNYAYCCL